MAVPLIDLKRQYEPIRADIDAAIKRVMDHGRFIMGPEMKSFEADIARFCGAKHAVGVASGTDALLVALRACGVAPGDEVITAAFSFFASAGVIARLGAQPVFVDIERDTYNLDPNRLADAVTDKTRAIIPIHLFGQCADMDPIMTVAEKHGIKVVEDAAQAIGSGYKDKKAGTIGDVGCFSFFPTKNLGCAGDGGMLITDDDDIAETARILRVHGGRSDYIHETVGYNTRLDTLQAALLAVKLPHLPAWTEARRKHAANYDEAFKNLPLTTPAVREWAYHIYNQYTVATDRRDDLMAWLGAREIGHKVYYPVPFHRQECFSDLGYRPGDLPECERAAATVLSLPVFGEMTDRERDEVIGAVSEFFC